MDPITLSAISMGGSLLGGGVGAVGSIMGGNAKSSMYQYQAGIARMNEKISKQNADWSRQTGESEAQRSGLKTRFAVGQEMVGQSSSNLNVNTGSAALVRDSQHEVGLVDQGVIRSNAARKAYGYDVEAENYKRAATMYNMAADDADTAGILGAFTSILGAATSVSSKWMQGSQVGFYGGSYGQSGYGGRA